MRKIGAICFILILFLVGCTVTDGGIPADVKNKVSETLKKSDGAKETIDAVVVKVTDGDTFSAKVNGKEEKIRLLLVDTPESVKPNTPVQPFALEASDFTQSVLPIGKTVKLEFDIGKRDVYGRLLAYVYVDGVMLNEQLLEKGFARVAVFPPNTKYVDEFRALQENAQAASVGIWRVENYAQDAKK